MRDGSGKPFERHTTTTQNAKIGQHFVWVMVVRCGEKIPAQAPLGEGRRAHDAQGLLLRRVLLKAHWNFEAVTETENA